MLYEVITEMLTLAERDVRVGHASPGIAQHDGLHACVRFNSGSEQARMEALDPLTRQDAALRKHRHADPQFRLV